jgi:hypothetical protein
VSPPGAERQVTLYSGCHEERTSLLCFEYCVEFGAGDVGVPLVSWHVTPSNSGVLS